MKNLRIALFFFIAAVSAASMPSFAQNKHAELIQRIAVSQGLLEIFEQQLVQQRDSMNGYATKLFDECVAESGGQANMKAKTALEHFMAKVATIFSAAEITSAWTSAYGKDLSEQELQEILKYYESPIGRKDVAANKSAMVTFSTWMNQESLTRSTALLKEFAQELQAAQPGREK